MANEKAIACDICDEALTDVPEMTVGAGFNFVWCSQGFGSAIFYYTRCSDCCGKQLSLLERSAACVKRASRHGRKWQQAVDGFILRHTLGAIESGAVKMVAKT